MTYKDKTKDRLRDRIGELELRLDGSEERNRALEKEVGQLRRGGNSEAGERASRVAALRRLAVSLLLASEARRDEMVCSFRRDVLRNRLVPREKLVDWVERQAKKDGPATDWIEVPLPARTKFESLFQITIDPPVRIGKRYKISGCKRRLLKYPLEGVQVSVATAHGGVLERLMGLGQTLANRFGWQEGQATAFVLSDTVPAVSVAECAAKLMMMIPAISRVELSLDPTLSPSQAANLYQQARKEIVSGRHRPMEEKHLQLAIFSAERPDGESLDASRQGWNKRFPKWKYTQKQLTNFGRDLVRDPRRLLNPGSGGRSGQR